MKDDKKILKLVLEADRKNVLKQKENEKLNTYQVAEDSFVSFKHLQKVYPNGYHSVIDFNLDIKKGEFIVFVGPSGCGKTTTLRMVCGLEEISAGALFIDGTYANLLPPSDRGVAMVFQNYALFPHLTVKENIAYGLMIKKVKANLLDKDGKQIIGIDNKAIAQLNKEKKWILKNCPNNKEELAKIEHDIKEYQTHEVSLTCYRRLTKDEINEKVNYAAKILNLSELLDRKPAQLSGGQCQRVALGRVIVSDAKLLLMDEPLSNLDAKLRVSMRSEIIKLHKNLNATTIYVTHDQVEAMSMSDRIVVMNNAKIMQIGTPSEVYEHPLNLFVATFIGSPNMNTFKAFLVDNKVMVNDKIVYEDAFLANKLEIFYKNELANLDESSLKDFEGEVYQYKKDELDNKINTLKEIINSKNYPLIFGIRPEHLSLNESDYYLEGNVEGYELLGEEYHLTLKINDNNLILKTPKINKFNYGDTFKAYFKKEKVHLFDSFTGKTIV